jgi:cytochrome c6
MNATGSRMAREKTRDIVRYAVVHRSGGAFALLLLLAVFFFPAKAGAQTDATAALFKAKCAVCHGETGDGNTPVGKGMKLRDLRSVEVQKQTDAQLTTITCCGKGKMPGYQGKLSDSQITQLVAYVRTLAAKK